MQWIGQRTWAFLLDSLPPWEMALVGVPAGILWSLGCLALAGHLKQSRGWPTGYTRKVFHFLIFFSAALARWAGGTPALCLLGAACSLAIFYALWRGSGDLLYEAMARERDAPHRTYYILAPYVATLVGGLASSILFGSAAIVGFLVTGVGDAVGEPVGTRFGWHPYRVPSLATRATRTWEGSAAVFVGSVAAVAAAVALSPQWQFEAGSLVLIALIGLAAAGLEAVSPHGWDNAVLQIAPSGLAWWLFGGPGSA